MPCASVNPNLQLEIANIAPEPSGSAAFSGSGGGRPVSIGPDGGKGVRVDVTSSPHPDANTMSAVDTKTYEH